MGVYDYLSALASGASTASVAADNITAGSDVLATNFNGYDATMTNLSSVASALNANNSLLEAGHRVVTTVQKNALTGVTTGTMVYDSTLSRIDVWNGTAWVPISFMSGARVRVVRTSDTAALISAAPVTWQTTTYDPLGMWSAATPTVVTVPFSGIYSVSASPNIIFTGTPSNTSAGLNIHVETSSPAAILMTAAPFLQSSGTPQYRVNTTVSHLLFLNAGSTILLTWSTHLGSVPGNWIYRGAADDTTVLSNGGRSHMTVAYLGP